MSVCESSVLQTIYLSFTTINCILVFQLCSLYIYFQALQTSWQVEVHFQTNGLQWNPSFETVWSFFGTDDCMLMFWPRLFCVNFAAHLTLWQVETHTLLNGLKWHCSFETTPNFQKKWSSKRGHPWQRVYLHGQVKGTVSLLADLK